MLNTRINAIVHLSEPHAMEEAAAQTQRMKSGEFVGPLAGVPIAVKDCSLDRQTRSCTDFSIVAKYFVVKTA